MKIVIAGGNHEAEFIIKMFKGRKNDLVVINPRRDVADTLMKRTRVACYVGEPSRRYALDEANAHDADVFIALSEKDADNYASCILAKKCFNARKCICVVSNPKNVDLYKSLGIDSVISSSYLLGQSVKSESSVEDIIKTISVENDKIVMIEATILSKYKLCGKTLMEAKFPRYASVSCIYRTPDVIIPKGDTVIQAKDKLLLVCAPSDQKKVLAFVSAEREE